MDNREVKKCETEKQCMNCHWMKVGSCDWPQRKICDEYMTVSSYYKDNKEIWPKYGDATYIALGIR